MEGCGGARNPNRKRNTPAADRCARLTPHDRLTWRSRLTPAPVVVPQRKRKGSVTQGAKVDSREHHLLLCFFFWQSQWEIHAHVSERGQPFAHGCACIHTLGKAGRICRPHLSGAGVSAESVGRGMSVGHEGTCRARGCRPSLVCRAWGCRSAVFVTRCGVGRAQ